MSEVPENALTPTPWFPVHVKPTRKGWYQVRGLFAELRKGKRGIVWRYWTGVRWMWLSTVVRNMMPAAVSPAMGDEWRGVQRGEASQRRRLHRRT